VSALLSPLIKVLYSPFHPHAGTDYKSVPVFYVRYMKVPVKVGIQTGNQLLPVFSFFCATKRALETM